MEALWFPMRSCVGFDPGWGARGTAITAKDGGRDENHAIPSLPRNRITFLVRLLLQLIVLYFEICGHIADDKLQR